MILYPQSLLSGNIAAPLLLLLLLLLALWLDDPIDLFNICKLSLYCPFLYWGTEQYEKEEIGKLLRFESSSEAEDQVSLPEYCSRMRPGQRDIYYLAAPSRQLAESSPYYEAMKVC